MRRGARLAGGAGAIVLALAGPAVAAGAAQPGAAAAVRPGPAILYAPLASAPQLENTGPWRAAPILVSGTAAYRSGEYLYQDYLYDDHGAKAPGTPVDAPADPGDRRTNNGFSAPNGTYTYPSDRVYAENAADLVELRVKRVAGATAFRVTLNTMNDPGRVAISIALGGAAGTTHPFPFGANVSAPADLFLTVHPEGGEMVAELDDATSGHALAGPAPSATVDVARRQVDVRVPDADWDPAGRASVRLAAGVGLWDRAAGAYLVPGYASDATHPGGAGSLAHPAAFFNVAFRFHEPAPVYGTAFGRQFLVDPAWWRDADQGAALATNDISNLYAAVDFRKLAAGVDDESGVPQAGPMDRILASHFEPAQGVDYASSCYSGDNRCQYQGRLQPYNVYIPRRPAPPRGYGMTLLLHGNAANYNEFYATRNQSELGERGTGSIVVSPQDRDPGSSYIGYGAADAFEAWADIAARYRLDPSWNAISGYSLGGLGTYKFSEQFPDLFARAMTVVGTPGGFTPSTPVPYTGETAELASLRNIPIMIWDVTADELNPNAPLNAANLDQLGYRYDWWEFPGDHFSLALNDEYGPAAAFLGTSHVDPNPPHITYVYDVSALDGLARPTGDYPQLGFVADHAYWLSGLRLRSGGQGTIDAFSHGFGVGDPLPSATQHGAGTLDGGLLLPTYPYAETSRSWGPAPPLPRADAIDLRLQNVSAVTIDVGRAQADCAVALHVVSDGPVSVHLAGCPARVPLAGAVAGATLPNTGAAQLPLPLLAALAFGLGGAAVLRQRVSRAATGR